MGNGTLENKDKNAGLNGLNRTLKYRLIVPIQRSRKSPEYRARGVAVGLFWAMTPLVGIQMWLCLMTWLPFRFFKQTDFSLIIACAWTWVTNVFTMFPIYYVFYVTGQMMLLRWHDLTGYQAFVDMWDKVLADDISFWQSMTEMVVLIAQQQGLAMMVGAVPWAIGSAILGYFWSLRFINMREARRTRNAPDNGDNSEATSDT